MKYKLIIDKESEEQIIAIVQAPSEFTEQIENLVLAYTGKDKITGYTDDGITQLPFYDIECITIYNQVWDEHSAYNVDDVVKSQIRALRKKLSITGKEYIKNVWGVGYRFHNEPGNE